MPQLAHHLGSALDILKRWLKKGLCSKAQKQLDPLYLCQSDESVLTAHVYSSFSTVTTAKWLSPAHTCWALLPPLNMSIFWGVNFPPPQKYTSLERVVTTATGVSVTVLSLWCKPGKHQLYTTKSYFSDHRQAVKMENLLWFFHC